MNLIEKIQSFMCDTCKTCEVHAMDDKENKYTIQAGYCSDGSGQIELDLYDSKGSLINTCSMNDFTDSCQLPYNLTVDDEPDCDCL